MKKHSGYHFLSGDAKVNVLLIFKFSVLNVKGDGYLSSGQHAYIILTPLNPTFIL